jgi:rhodanese-related sulfurtransferase
MNDIEKTISNMNFQYFGTKQHGIDADIFLATENAVFLDVRAYEEVESVKIQLGDFCDVLEIPTDEIPGRINEIPKNRLVGVFCSAGVRAAIIFAYLKSKEYNVKIILGGYPPLMEALMPGKIYKRIQNK